MNRDFVVFTKNDYSVYNDSFDGTLWDMPLSFLSSNDSEVRNVDQYESCIDDGCKLLKKENFSFGCVFI